MKTKSATWGFHHPTKINFVMMKLKFLNILIIVGFVGIITLSCKKDEPEVDLEAKLNSEIMAWMYDAMEQVYFWNSYLPSLTSVVKETDPEVFFYKLIYETEDHWSWLTKDYAALMEDFAGTPTSMGISPVYGKFYDSEQVFILISYVYPGSPADRAGIERGDIIMKINGQDLNTTNYIEMFNQDSYSVNMGIYFNGSISTRTATIQLAAEVIDSNPIIFDTILVFNNHKIGYLVYVEFISGNEGNLLYEFGALIDEFKNQGVTDLVVDLRYNPGGEITAANYLASCLAPVSDVSTQEIFVKFVYNPMVQTYIEREEGDNSPNLVNRFSGNGHNLDLTRVFFLTGDHSASASELLIIGLEPYMEVIQIGDPTYGKFTGAWVLTDTNDPPKHNWAIVPIVSKYSNSVGFTDFVDGLAPDYLINDNLFEAKAFGDVADPMLGQAVELITGQPLGLKKSIEPAVNYLKLPDPSQFIKSNLFLPKPGFLNPTEE